VGEKERLPERDNVGARAGVDGRSRPWARACLAELVHDGRRRMRDWWLDLRCSAKIEARWGGI